MAGQAVTAGGRTQCRGPAGRPVREPQLLLPLYLHEPLILCHQYELAIAYLRQAAQDLGHDRFGNLSRCQPAGWFHCHLAHPLHLQRVNS